MARATLLNAAASPEPCILVFAKAPVAGEVKTRLIKLLGAEGAKDLYQKLVVRTVQTALAAQGADVQLWCTPEKEHPFFVHVAATYAVELREQRGADLGERMLSAAQDTLEAGAYPVIIGCDCPELRPQDLNVAAAALSAGRDAVLGPAQDGGFYLLGLRRTMPRMFKGMAWGTNKVLEETRGRLRALSWRCHELEMRWDLDRSEDYLVWLKIAGESEGTRSQQQAGSHSGY